MSAQLTEFKSGHGVANVSDATPPKEQPLSGLLAAFESVERFPVLTDSRARVRAAATTAPEIGEIIGVVESDVGLMIAALRLANRGPRNGGTGVADVPAAIDVVGPLGIVALAGAAATFDLHAQAVTASSFDQFRFHSLFVQRTADQIAMLTMEVDRAELAVCSLLHDIGALVLAFSPDERLRDERAALGLNHALLGGALARRWRLPTRITSAIEDQHAKDASGLAAHVGLADMLVHYGMNDPTTANRVEDGRRACGLTSQDLDRLLREHPGSPRLHTPTACPLSDRELDVLRRLAEGKAYKEIAATMRLTTSTVRTHLHNAYGKMNVTDRAHAVLTATRLGWI